MRALTVALKTILTKVLMTVQTSQGVDPMRALTSLAAARRVGRTKDLMKKVTKKSQLGKKSQNHKNLHITTL